MSKNLNRVNFSPLLHFFSKFFKILNKSKRFSKIRRYRARIFLQTPYVSTPEAYFLCLRKFSF